MKIRTDFVTNSSSSSFMLTQKGDFTEEQKEAILQYVKERLLGEVFLTPDSSEEQIQEAFRDEYIEEEEEQDQIRQQLAEGRTIRRGWINFDGDGDNADIFTDLWELLEEIGPDTFSVLDDDLSY